ncbi:MAG: hypothetical protein B6U76_07085 [Desulfurococcales archaeon ex4484_217_2]|nr:MAG: hypothetical protein B6U76_07085 [Desulfurococcales archaeon ex4484_217_2]
MSINFRLYKDGDEEQIVEVINSAFTTFREWGLDRDSWLEYDADDYAFDKNMALVAEADGRIVGHIMIVLREFKLGVETYIKFGGIANVSTHPDYRGRGIATKLMTKAVEVCREKSLPLSSLLTGFHGVAHGIYRKIGYTDTIYMSHFWGKRKEIENAYSKIGFDTNVNVREVSRNDIEVLSRVYDLWSRSYNGVCRRPLDYWRKKIIEKSYYHSFFYVSKGIYKIVSTCDSKVTGYAIYGISDETDRRIGIPPHTGGLFELVALDDKSRVTLFKHVLGEFIDKKVKRVVLHLPHSKEYFRLTRHFIEIGEDTVLMDYITNQPLLFNMLTQELQSCLERYGGFNRMKITLASDFGTTTIKVSGCEIEIFGEVSENYIYFEKDSFVRMIYGIEGFSDVLGKKGIVKVRTEDFQGVKELLSILFPRRDFHIWKIDNW